VSRAEPSALALWALLFATGRAVPRVRLAAALGLDAAGLAEAEAGLARHLEDAAAPLALEAVGSGLQLVLRPGYHALARALVGEAPARLSTASLETLAVIAYGQPASRTAVEAARGVRAERSLAILLERGLVREAAPPRGAAPDEGPYYATTQEFLDAFGLAALSDLPPWPGPAQGPCQAALPLDDAPADDGESGTGATVDRV
jgi:segregation and condensation protein B